MLKIYPVLCRAGNMDNYAYILQDKKSGISAVIDPSEPEPIIQKLQELKLEPSYILNTHHHFDHTDGNLALKQRYGAKVVANINDSSRIPGFDIGVTPGEDFSLGESRAEIIDVSAHTQGHILWYFPKDKAVFTGDTLFVGCVGFCRSREMFRSLRTKILPLSDRLTIYSGHDYGPVPFRTLGEEKRENPYLRADSLEEFRAALLKLE